MAQKPLSSPHLGGPLGLAGLVVMITAAGGLALVASSDVGREETRPLKAEAALDAPSSPDTDAPPAGEPEAQYRPQSAPRVSIQSAPTLPAIPPLGAKAAPPRGAHFIVRLKGDPILDDLARVFRRDADAAKRAFQDWAADNPDFACMSLTDVSYSGELILRCEDCEDSVDASPSAVKAFRDRLQGVDSVRYADPDYQARPEGGSE